MASQLVRVFESLDDHHGRKKKMSLSFLCSRCHSAQDKKKATLTVSLCSRTKLIKNAKQDLQDLGAGVKME